MKQLFIIAHTMDGVGLEIETFYDAWQTTRRIKALKDSGYRDPHPGEDPRTYWNGYQDWIQEENDNMCENDIALHVEDLEDQAPAALPAQPAAEETPSLDDNQQALLLALKTWRKDKASESEKPEAMIFQNAVLESIAKAQPKTTPDLAKIKGVGEHKIKLYGDDLLAICNAFD